MIMYFYGHIATSSFPNGHLQLELRLTCLYIDMMCQRMLVFIRCFRAHSLPMDVIKNMALHGHGQTRSWSCDQDKLSPLATLVGLGGDW